MNSTPYLALYTCPLLERPVEDARNRTFCERTEAIERELAKAPPPGLVRSVPLPATAVRWPAYVAPGAGYPKCTLSVWRDLATAFDYSYRDRLHHEALRHRRDWFRPVAHPTYVLWYVDEPALATFDEGAARLDRLCADGPGPGAFDFRHPYGADGRPQTPQTVRGGVEREGGPGQLRFDPGKRQ